MFSNLFDTLINNYSQVPSTPIPTTPANNQYSLMQTANPIGMRTPDYLSLMGLLGAQNTTPPVAGSLSDDYLSRVLGAQQQQRNPINMSRLFSKDRNTMFGGIIAQSIIDKNFPDLGNPTSLMHFWNM